MGNEDDEEEETVRRPILGASATNEYFHLDL